MILDDLIRPAIILCPGASIDEVDEFVKREEVAYLSMTQLLSGAISFQDYLDCLEVAGVNIDDFLVIANTNSAEAGF